MVHLTRIALALTGTLATTALSAQDFRFAPGTSTYVLTQEQTATQGDLLQQKTFTSNNYQRFAVTLARRSADTLAFSVDFDSVSISSSSGAALPDVSKIRGTQVTGLMSPSGAVYDVQTSLHDFPQMGESFRYFFGTMPGSLQPGASRVDTIKSSTSNNGLDIRLQNIVTSTVVGDTTIGGHKAWKVKRTGTLSMSGSGAAGGGLRVEGTGSIDQTSLVSGQGVLLGSVTTQTVNSTLTAVAQGQTLPISTHSTTTVERVK